MKNKKYLYSGIFATIFCALIVGLGWVYIVYSSPGTTTIGEDISTTNLTVSGNATTSGNQVISGAFSVTGTTTLTGNVGISGELAAASSLAVDGGAFFYDAVFLGDESTDEVRVAGLINTDLIFDSGQRNIKITQAPMGSGGANLIIAASAGKAISFEDQSGGTLLLQGGAKANAGTDGMVRIGLSNTSAVEITPNTTITGTLDIGGGTAISKHISATSSIDVPNVASSTCITATTTVTGAATGDTVVASPIVTPPNGLPALGIEDLDLIWNVYVIAADTVQLTICNPTESDTDNIDPQPWRFDIWKH